MVLQARRLQPDTRLNDDYANGPARITSLHDFPFNAFDASQESAV